jgi:hypothetical protein
MKIRTITMSFMMLSLSIVAVPATAHAQRGGPCDRIVAACLQAGFVPHGGREGYGLARDCLRPIIEGQPQRPRAVLPLPPINPRVVLACRNSDQNFAFGPTMARRPGVIPPAGTDDGQSGPAPVPRRSSPSLGNKGNPGSPAGGETSNGTGPGPEQDDDAGEPPGRSVAESGPPPSEAGPPPDGPASRNSGIGPCERILAACRRAGFVPGGAKSGVGLQADCVRPIMSGGEQPRRAAQALPPISPRLVSACRASNPNFGQPRAGRRSPHGTEAPPSDAGPPPPQSEPSAPPPEPAPRAVPDSAPPANE